MDDLDKELEGLIAEQILEVINPEGIYSCIRCGHWVDTDHRFCIFCGQPNKNFDREAFYHLYKTYDIQAVIMEKCDEIHAERASYIREEIQARGKSISIADENPLTRYCQLCGKDCIPPELLGKI